MTSGAKIDPELVKQLETAAASDKKDVEAVIRLKPDEASQVVPTADRTEALANELLDRVKGQAGEPATRHNVFRNLGSFVVAAPAPFIRKLISQPEVAAATANQQPGSAAMPPVKKTAPRKPAKSKAKKGSTQRRKGAK